MSLRTSRLLSRLLLAVLPLGVAGTAEGADLEVSCGFDAFNVWDDAGSGAETRVTFYLAEAAGDQYPLGVTADDTDRGERSTLCLVRDISPNRDALVPPADYERIWWDRGSGATRDGAIWSPVCPENYTGVGVMVQASYRKPGPDAIRCVRQELTVPGAATGEHVYKDNGSSAFEDLSVWRVEAGDGFDVGAVFALATHTKPKEEHGVRLLRRSAVRVSE